MALNPNRYPKALECLVLLIYLSLLALVMSFHEPWFDEAQVWLIARDASIWDMIASIPHYEGHPPIWSLILMPLAKSGIPFEIGIKSVNFLFAGLSMGILIFLSPFPRPIRLVIPFTFFFFYQYGVISRPYSLMMLGFVLSARFYRTRNEKPMRFGISLAVLCASSAYGIVIAAGICLVWIWEYLIDRKSVLHLRSIMKSGQARVLVGLFVFCAILIALMWPYADTFGARIIQNNTYAQRLFYMFFIAPGDALGSQSYFANSINIGFNIPTAGGLIFGLFVNATLLCFVSVYRKFSLLVLPYSCFSIFSGIEYFSTHHIGIITMFYVFVLWVCMDDKPSEYILPRCIQNMVQVERDVQRIKAIGLAVATISVVLSLYWSMASVYLDVRYNYGSGKDVSSFLVDHQLVDKRIATSWLHLNSTKTKKELIDYNGLEGVFALPYFKQNIYFNLNSGANESFLTHRIDSEGIAMKKLLQNTIPEVWIGMPALQDVYGSSLSIKDYALVAAIADNKIFKGTLYEGYTFIYLRKDLMEQFPELPELNPIDYYVFG